MSEYAKQVYLILLKALMELEFYDSREVIWTDRAIKSKTVAIYERPDATRAVC